MKRILAMLLAMMLIIALFAGCSNDAAKTDDTSSSSSSSSSETKKEEKKEDKKEETPPAEETIVLTAFVNSVSEFNPANEVHQELVKQTGIDVQYTFATTDDGQELTTMLASGDLPDFIRYNTNSAFRSSLWSQGFLAPLSQLIDEYVPEMWEDVPENMDLFWTESDGNWYCIPQYYGDSERYEGIEGLSTTGLGFVIDKNIYEELGSPAMTTLDEYTEVLRAVKANYSDKIIYPLYLQNVGTISNIDGLEIVCRAFGSSGYKSVDENYNTHMIFEGESFKKAIIYLNGLYNEGIFNPEMFTAHDSVKEILNDDAIFSFWGQGIAPWSWYSATDGNFPFDIVEIPREEGVELKLKHSMASIGGGNGTSISATSENKDAAIKYCAYLMSHEGQMLVYHGIEGDHYTLVDGYPKNSDEKNTAWNENWNKLTSEMGVMGVDSWFPTLSTDGRYYYHMNADLPWYADQEETNGKYATSELIAALATVQGDSEEAVIEAKINEHYCNALPTMILAEGTDECIAAYEKFIGEVEAMGLETLKAAYSETAQGWLAKLGK